MIDGYEFWNIYSCDYLKDICFDLSYVMDKIIKRFLINKL